MWQRIAFAGVLVASLSACRNKEANVRLKIIVVDDAQQVVSGAYIIADGKALGLTNNKGVLTQELLLPKEKVIPITIGKESATAYFAPVNDSLAISAEGQQNIQKHAVLYSVPKPKDLSVDEPVAAEPVVAEVKPEDTKPAEPMVAAEPEVAITGPLPLTLRVKTVTASGQAIPDVETLLGNMDTKTLQPLCTTDKTGSCETTITTLPGTEVTLYSKKLGYITKTRRVNAVNDLNVKVALDDGSGVDLTVTQSLNKTDHVGFDGAAVMLGERKLGVTDAFGHFFFKLPKGRQSVKTLKVIPSGTPTMSVVTLDLYEIGSQVIKKDVYTGRPWREDLWTMPVTVASEDAGNSMNIEDAKRRAGIIDGWIETFSRQEKLPSWLDAPSSFHFDGTHISGEAEESRYLLTAQMQLGGMDRLNLTVLDPNGEAVWKDSIALGSNASRDNFKRAMIEALKALPIHGSIKKLSENNGLTVDFGNTLARGIRNGGTFSITSLVTNSQGTQHTSQASEVTPTVKSDMLWSELQGVKMPPRTILNVGDPVVFTPVHNSVVASTDKLTPWLRVVTKGNALEWHLKTKDRLLPLASQELMNWATLGTTAKAYATKASESYEKTLNVDVKYRDALLFINEKSPNWQPILSKLTPDIMPPAAQKARNGKI